jgi:hypothetical protein
MSISRSLQTALFVAITAFAGLVAIGCEGQDTTATKDGVYLGAKIEDVEQKLGPPETVLPNFGREQRIYKSKSGNKYMLTVEDGKVVEIH